MTAVVVIGADDHGIAPATSATIRALVVAGRLSATSSMVGFPAWEREGSALRELDGQADLGLHLTLTDHAPSGPMPTLAPGGRLPSFGALARASVLRRLPDTELRDEVHRQLDAFERVVGRPPDYVDGHHHVHQLPQVREVLVAALARRVPGCVVRTCYERLGTAWSRGVGLDRALAFGIAARGLRRLCDHAHLPTTHGFAGAYDFSRLPPYAARFERFLRGARDGTFVMCHPGTVDDQLVARDSLTHAREAERDFLAGDGFAAVLELADVRVGRLSDALSLPGR